MMYSSS